MNVNVIQFPNKKEIANPSSSKQKEGLVKIGPYYHFIKIIDGRRIKKSTKQITRELARLWVEKNILSPMRESDLGIKKINDINFERFADDHFLPFATISRKPKTVKFYEERLKALRRYFGKMNLSQISKESIDRFMIRRLQEPIACNNMRKGLVSPSTVNKDTRVLSVLCEYAIETQFLKKNPVEGRKALQETQYQARFMTEDEFNEKFLPAANPRGDYGKTELYALIFNLGLRVGQALSLKWEHINFKNDMITVLNNKNDPKPRYLPMNNFISNMLKDLKSDSKSEYVFANQFRNYKPFKDIRKGIRSALKRARLPMMRPHDFRHSFVSNSAEKGHTWDKTSAITGHKSFWMYQRYRHLFDKSAFDVVNSFKAPTNFRSSKEIKRLNKKKQVI